MTVVLTAPLVLAVLAAGAAGAVIRFTITQLITAPKHPTKAAGFPWAVLVVNTVGSAIAGLIVGLQAIDAVSPGWTLILLTGLCGGLTTFSTLSVETMQLVLRDRTRTAVINVVTNVGFGLGFAWLSFTLVVASS